MGWFTINKLLIIFSLLVLAGCGREEVYTKQDIKTRPPSGIRVKDELGIGLSYKLKKDSKIYTDDDMNTDFDSLEKGTIVTINQEEENGFVYVTYQGQGFYIKISDLEGV